MEQSELLRTLLYEGYALYPYTPGATKNATPTPFGIVYPAAYAAGNPHTFDELVLRATTQGRRELAVQVPSDLAGEGVQVPRDRGAQAVQVPSDLAVEVLVVGLVAEGERHKASELVVEIPATGFDALPVTRSFEREVVSGSVTVAVADGVLEVRVRNTTTVPEGLSRSEALRYSVLSCHVTARLDGGVFVSPLEAPQACVNTWPVLASDDDREVLGAAIVLPDHPQLAPESTVGMFDGTEMDEALLLHVQVLSDAELADIEEQDPKVREMIARAAAATPAQVLATHGRMTLTDPLPPTPPAEFELPPLQVFDEQGLPVRDPDDASVGSLRGPDGLPRSDPREGVEEAVDGARRFRRGTKVVLRPDPAKRAAPVEDSLLTGKVATIGRIFVDVDGKVHLGVTIDEDPGRDLFGESGRYLFFFPPEVEVIEA